MCELRTNNAVLSDRLESLGRSCSSSSPSSVQISLLNEMEMSTSGSDSDRSLYNKRYKLILSRNPTTTFNKIGDVSSMYSTYIRFYFRPCSQIDEEIEDIDEAGGVGDDSEITCVNSMEIKQVRAYSESWILIDLDIDKFEYKI